MIVENPFTRNIHHAAVITGKQADMCRAIVRLYEEQEALARHIGVWIEQNLGQGYYDIEAREVVLIGEDGTETRETLDVLPMRLVANIGNVDRLAKWMKDDAKNWGKRR